MPRWSAPSTASATRPTSRSPPPAACRASSARTGGPRPSAPSTASSAISCMGYEIAGAWGQKMANPDRDVIAMVGDGSYLMMNSDIYSTVLTGHKLIVVVMDNGGFAVINRLQNAKGSKSFNNLIADSKIEKLVEVDFAQHAASMGAHAETVHSIGDLEQAFARAKKADRTAVIVIKVQSHQWTPGDAVVGGRRARGLDPQGSPRRPCRFREGQGQAADRRLRPSASAVGSRGSRCRLPPPTADSSSFQQGDNHSARPNPTRRRADRLVEQRHARARRRDLARDLPQGRAEGRLHRHRDRGQVPDGPGGARPDPQEAQAGADLGLVLGRTAQLDRQGRAEAHDGADRHLQGARRARYVYAETTGTVQNKMDAPLSSRPRLAEVRLPRLWPEAHRARRVDGRLRRADDLPPPHGDDRRDRARDRPPDAPHRQGGRAPPRHRPSHLRRRRRGRDHAHGTAAASTTSTARTFAPTCSSRSARRT